MKHITTIHIKKYIDKGIFRDKIRYVNYVSALCGIELKNSNPGDEGLCKNCIKTLHKQL